MIKIYLLCFLIGILALPVMGQEFFINYQPGAGIYSMHQLKDLQQQRLRLLEVNAGIAHKYPVHLNHQLQFGRTFASYESGLVYRRQSTGSRISYKDYSGELALDTRIGAHGVGLFISKSMWQKGDYNLKIFGQGMVLFSKLSMIDNITIYPDVHETERLNLYSNGFLLEPGLRLSRTINKFVIGAEAGININIYNEDLHLSGEKNFKALDLKGDFFKPNWSGARLSLMVGLNF